MHKYLKLVPGAFPRKKLAACILALAVSAILLPAGANPQKTAPPNLLMGTLSSPVRMDVFSDFQCEACRFFYVDTVTRLLKTYAASNKVCVIYHEFPLERHAYARQAALYAIAAQRIGKKQWMVVLDALYTKQTQWAQDGNLDRALIGAVSNEDLIRIKSIAREPYIKNALDHDIALGDKIPVKQTPTIIWTEPKGDSQVIDQSLLPYDTWRRNIDRVIK